MTCYGKEIRKAKIILMEEVVPGISYVPGSGRFMKITAIPTANRVSTMKLTAGH
jgi:hypothetical protein